MKISLRVASVLLASAALSLIALSQPEHKTTPGAGPAGGAQTTFFVHRLGTDHAQAAGDSARCGSTRPGCRQAPCEILGASGAQKAGPAPDRNSFRQDGRSGQRQADHQVEARSLCQSDRRARPRIRNLHWQRQAVPARRRDHSAWRSPLSQWLHRGCGQWRSYLFSA